MTFEQLRELALALPEVYERLCYGTPAFYVGKKLIARMLEDSECVVINHSELYRHALVKTNPKVFSIPPHYKKYAMIVVNLEAITQTEFKPLLTESWRRVASERLK
jgi:hypothetical protein